MSNRDEKESLPQSISMSTPSIPENMPSKDFATSNFSQVIFPDISDYFPPDKDVHVVYVLTEALEPTSRDWIGLFKVGWTSPREYLTFVWAPKISSNATDRTVNATFSAYYLPNDKNEFYQFCYVTKQGYVRGASTPFQFRLPMECDQLVEVEDETGMIVLKTKTAALEEQLDKITTQKVKLEAIISDLNKEKSNLESELTGVQAELKSALEAGAAEKEQSQKLEAEVKETKAKLKKVNDELKKATSKMTRQKKELDNAAGTIAKLTKDFLGLREDHEKSTQEHTKEVSSLSEQLDEKVEKLTQAECTVVDLQEKLKKLEKKTTDLQKKHSTVSSKVEQSVSVLTNERDEARGKAQTYKEEKDLFKDQFTHSEEARREVMQQLSVLKEKLLHKEQEVRQRDEKVLAYEEKTKILKMELRDASKQATIQKTTMDNRLSNAEDKLSAFEASKRLIASELTEARDRRDQLMSELHQTKKEKDQLSREADAARRQLSELEKNYLSTLKRAERGEQRIAEKENRIAEERKRARENEKELKEQISILRSQLECADMAVANAASSSDQDTSDTSTQTNKEKEKVTQEDLRAKDNVIDDLKMQIEDLRTRLSMGAAAYTEKYMECHKLERKMKKIQGQKVVPKVTGAVQKSSLSDMTTSDSQDDASQQKKKTPAAKPTKDKKGSTSSSSKKESAPEQPEEMSTGTNFMSKLEQLFMAIADPDAEEQEQASQLRVKLQDLETSVQFQHSKYKKYKQLYQDEKKVRTTQYEKHNEEMTLLKIELEEIKTQKELLYNENEALKDQLDEFVKSSSDANVIKARNSTGTTMAAPRETSMGSRYNKPTGLEEIQDRNATGSVKRSSDLLYGNPYKTDIITRDNNSSDSDLSGEFELANSRFHALGLCPKNNSSEESDHIEISRPPVDSSPPTTVINRQPIRSPPLIEVISDETTSDDLSSPASLDDDAAAQAYNSRSSAMQATATEKTSGTRRRRTGKGKKSKSRKSYA